MTANKLYIPILSFFLLTLISCSNVYEVDVILQFNEKPDNFENLDNNEMKQRSNSVKLKTKEFILMLEESSKESYFLVKGGWKYVGILYKDGSNKKLRLNCVYGIYQDIESNHYYKIKGDASLGNGLCEKFIIE